MADWLRRQRRIASVKLTSEEILSLQKRDFAHSVPSSSLELQVLLPDKRQDCELVMAVGPRSHACLHREQSLVVAHGASSARVLVAGMSPRTGVSEVGSVVFSGRCSRQPAPSCWMASGPAGH